MVRKPYCGEMMHIPVGTPSVPTGDASAPVPDISNTY